MSGIRAARDAAEAGECLHVGLGPGALVHQQDRAHEHAPGAADLLGEVRADIAPQRGDRHVQSVLAAQPLADGRQRDQRQVRLHAAVVDRDLRARPPAAPGCRPPRGTTPAPLRPNARGSSPACRERSRPPRRRARTCGSFCGPRPASHAVRSSSGPHATGPGSGSHPKVRNFVIVIGHQWGISRSLTPDELLKVRLFLHPVTMGWSPSDLRRPPHPYSTKVS